jgi:hypothetical protein
MITEDHFTYWSTLSLRILFARLPFTLRESATFGLGRDFVGWIDRFRRPPHPNEREYHQPGWDTNRKVLALEQILNRFLGVAGGGVGIEFILQRIQANSDSRAAV